MLLKCFSPHSENTLAVIWVIWCALYYGFVRVVSIETLWMQKKNYVTSNFEMTTNVAKMVLL